MAENSADIAKRIILGCIAEGMTVDAACASAGKSMKTYEYYRRTDKVFADKMDRTRLGLKDKAFASGDGVSDGLGSGVGSTDGSGLGSGDGSALGSGVGSALVVSHSVGTVP